jgi:thymidine kinase
MTSELVFFYSSMNAGKSLSLLTKAHSLKTKGFKTILMKPEIDTRTDGTIETRLGVSEKCITIGKTELPSEKFMKSKKNKPDFVFIDEAQFLTKEQVWDLAQAVDNWDITVYCYGLRIDWKGDFFSGSEELFKISDRLEAIETYCRINKGALAFFHIKKKGTGDAVEIGAEDMYETASRKVWTEWIEKAGETV